MFEGKNFSDILAMGGYSLQLLLLISIISVTIIICKTFEFWVKTKIKVKDFVSILSKQINFGNYDAAIKICDSIISPIGSVAKIGIIAFRENDGDIAAAMQREIFLQVVKLERFTTLLATIGSISVYVGLFGTVVGIIRAFHDIAQAGSGGISIVIVGVSEALIATAAGLFTAIPAVTAYNFFAKKIEVFTVNMEYCASCVDNILKGKPIK
ncbi:MAG: MotA/TolQ/ExbB proton channel family protein [Elusimicrobiota bacterium]|jgi:biopolymer transport protein ExbB/TolQ|nr:MotA/TolQ/ExbB proton channel family protein [Elusimicrobiota bacterium]